MADVAKTYGVGDTVWVHYINSIALQFMPVQRIVAKVTVLTSTNEALVSFTSGDDIVDGAVKTVYDTQALCATAIVNYFITKTASVVSLDPTLSVASTVNEDCDTLGRIGNGTSAV